jgi:hypothetical protein
MCWAVSRYVLSAWTCSPTQARGVQGGRPGQGETGGDHLHASPKALPMGRSLVLVRIVRRLGRCQAHATDGTATCGQRHYPRAGPARQARRGKTNNDDHRDQSNGTSLWGAAWSVARGSGVPHSESTLPTEIARARESYAPHRCGTRGQRVWAIGSTALRWLNMPIPRESKIRCCPVRIGS